MPTIENLDIQITASASDAASKIGRVASALSGVRGPSTSAKSGLKDVSDGAKVVSDSTQKATGKIQNLRKEANLSGKSTSSLARFIQNVGERAKKAVSGINSFLSSLKRIAFYRAVRSIIREISDAFKEGSTNVYEWSKRLVENLHLT